MPRSVQMFGAVAVSATLLSGCLNLDVDSSVSPDATATGAMTVEVNQQAGAVLGITSSEALARVLESGELEGAEPARDLDCTALERSGASAVSCVFENQEFTEVGELWRITSDESTVTFHSRGGDPGESIVDHSLVDQWNLFPQGDD